MFNFTFTIINSDNPDQRYEISMNKDNKVWISDGTGEGGEFNDKAFFKVIDKFYKENF